MVKSIFLKKGLRKSGRPLNLHKFTPVFVVIVRTILLHFWPEWHWSLFVINVTQFKYNLTNILWFNQINLIIRYDYFRMNNMKNVDVKCVRVRLTYFLIHFVYIKTMWILRSPFLRKMDFRSDCQNILYIISIFT